MVKPKPLPKNGHKKTIDMMFLVMASIILLYTIYSAITNMLALKDCIFVLLVIGIFYFVQKDYHIPPAIIIIGFVPLMLHLSGLVFGFYESLIFGIGYDKVIHFTNAFSGTIVLFYILIAHSKTMPVNKALVAMLVVLGVGSVVEDIEFVGGKYLHITGPTILSEDGFSASVKESIMQQLSLSPSIQKDMIEHDTQWDMLFNTAGVMVAALVLSILWHVDHSNLKNRIHVHE